jgi:hypothetical protein
LRYSFIHFAVSWFLNIRNNLKFLMKMNTNENGYKYIDQISSLSRSLLFLFLSFECKTQIELWICFYAACFVKIMMFFHHRIEPQVLVCIFLFKAYFLDNFISSGVIFFLLFDLPILYSGYPEYWDIHLSILQWADF